MDAVVVAFFVFEWGLIALNQAVSVNIMFMRLLRVAALARILRTFRSQRFLRELRRSLDCVIGSVINFFSCLVLMFFVLYVRARLSEQALNYHIFEYMSGHGTSELPGNVDEVMTSFGIARQVMP